MRARALVDAVALAVQLVILECLGRHRAEGVEPDVERDALDVERREQLGREVQPAVGAAAEPSSSA